MSDPCVITGIIEINQINLSHSLQLEYYLDKAFNYTIFQSEYATRAFAQGNHRDELGGKLFISRRKSSLRNLAMNTNRV